MNSVCWVDDAAWRRTMCWETVFTLLWWMERRIGSAGRQSTNQRSRNWSAIRRSLDINMAPCSACKANISNIKMIILIGFQMAEMSRPHETGDIITWRCLLWLLDSARYNFSCKQTWQLLFQNLFKEILGTCLPSERTVFTINRYRHSSWCRPDNVT